MIIFLAGLRQIPAMYYEAAAVDGASTLQQFWRITLPLLTPIIFFNLVLQIIGAFQSFTQAFVVSGGTGGPSDSTMFYTLYLYQKGFGQFDMGYASAMAWFLLVIIAAFTAINFSLRSIGCSTMTDLQTACPGEAAVLRSKTRGKGPSRAAGSANPAARWPSAAAPASRPGQARRADPRRRRDALPAAVDGGHLAAAQRR